MPQDFPYKRAIMILADGARPDVLAEELGKGRLPHLEKYFAKSGTNATMLTCFPSTTGPAYLPYVTGCFPGTCNIPGVRWFDKPMYAKKGWGLKSFRSYCGFETMLFDRDMNPNVKTVWQIFKNPKNIFNGVTRGLNKKNNLTFGKRMLHYYYAHLTDRWAFLDDAAYQSIQKMIYEKAFDFAFAVLPSIDEYSHRSSPFHPRVRQAYQELDQIVGKMIQDLKTVGLFEETLLIIVSDHGLSETKEHFDIGPWLEKEKKIKTLYYSNIFKFCFNAVSMVSGNGMTHLYFKGQDGWSTRKSFEEISSQSVLLDELRCRPEVDLVVTQGMDGAIHLQTEKGHGSFHVNDRGDILYRFDKKDPLGIFSDEGVQEKRFTLEESLQKTFTSQYPDLFMQMHQIFKSPRTGDVIVLAKLGYDLRVKFEHPLHKASHGSIHPEHMRVPLLMNHPISAQHIRSVDIFPTLLKLLGQEIPDGIDGRCLI